MAKYGYKRSCLSSCQSFLQVKTPTASLFSCENGHGAVNLSSNNKSPAVDDSLDVFDQSEDNVFEFQDMASEVKGTGMSKNELCCEKSGLRSF